MTKQNEKTAAELVSEQKPKVQTEAAKEVAKEAVVGESRMDTGTTGEPDEEANRFQGVESETNLLEPLLGAGFGALEGMLDKKDGLGEDKIAALLILERNGQNRTEYVKAMMKRLGIKDLRKELPQAGGPDFTNDTTNLSDL